MDWKLDRLVKNSVGKDPHGKTKYVVSLELQDSYKNEKHYRISTYTIDGPT